MSPMLSSHEGGGAWPGGVGGLPPGPLGAGGSLFGDGTYSENIYVGGVLVEPVASYLAGDGQTYLNCIVITGAATVAPDAETGAAGFSCQNIVLDGASASLTPTVNCKGLLGFVTGKVVLLNGAKMHMDRMGKAGNFGNLTAYTLAPASIRKKLRRALHDLYTVQGEGAAGGAKKPTMTAAATCIGNPGSPAGAMQTGGGGGAGGNHNTANSTNTPGAGGKGGPCCGGACSASFSAAGNWFTEDAGPYGGPGSSAPAGSAGVGGCGDPVGASAAGAAAAQGPGGGLLMLFAGEGFSIGAGCIVSADGSAGAGYINAGTGGTGGGCVALVTRSGLYTNLGTVRASGGPRCNSALYAYYGGDGGLGSVNIFQDAA